MHTVHFIAVEAETEEEAIMAAEGALEPYGDGQCWDWYAIGGRWDGILGGKNVLKYEDDPELWEKTIEGAYERMDSEYVECRNKCLGKEITSSEVADIGPFGFAVQDKAEYAKRVTESNRNFGAAFGRLLEWERVPRELENVHDESMAAYYMMKMCKLAMGSYTFDSPLLDGVEHSCWRTGIDNRCEENPGSQWLVAVDLHN